MRLATGKSGQVRHERETFEGFRPAASSKITLNSKCYRDRLCKYLWRLRFVAFRTPTRWRPGFAKKRANWSSSATTSSAAGSPWNPITIISIRVISTTCDVYVALRDAFDAIKRQLEEYVRIQRGEVKSHQAPQAI
jgi:hypothetical protein